jgi:nucleoside-diphosphate-sugar epimerase
MRWKGEFVVLPAERAPPHLLKLGNAAQHWTASSARIRHELGYEEPVAIEDAIRQTISWERKNPPAEALLSQFDYAAEDAAVAGHHP